jgi:hypothetical protein
MAATAVVVVEESLVLVAVNLIEYWTNDEAPIPPATVTVMM